METNDVTSERNALCLNHTNENSHDRMVHEAVSVTESRAQKVAASGE